MRLWRGAGRLVSWSSIALLMAPAAALPIAAVVVRTSSGEAVVSALPIGLTAFDGFAQTCLLRSALASAVAAIVSLRIGVPLGRIAGRGRGFGIGPLSALALAAAVASPVAGAIGLRGTLFPWLGALLRRPPADLGPWGVPIADLAGWAAFVWVEVAAGAPIVALATRAALGRIDPAWEDSARLSGASRRRVWRELTWPLIRPEALAAASIVFAWAILDPAAPLVFGLETSLAYQVVESSIAVDGWLPGAAAMALLGVGLAAIVRLAARSASGPSRLDRGPLDLASRPATTPSTTPTTAAALVVWLVIAWAPTISTGFLAIRPGPGGVLDAIRRSASELAADAGARTIGRNSLAIGLAVGVLGFLGSRPGTIRDGRFPGLSTLPPLAIGVGALAIPRLLAAASDGWIARVGGARPGWLVELSAWLDPYATPGVLMAWALLSCHAPALAAISAAASRRSRPALIDAAIVLGSSRGRARRTIARPLVDPAIRGAALLAATLSATSLAPALVLSPTSRERPVGPAILWTSGEAGRLRTAAGLGIAASALNLAGWIVAGRAGRTLVGGQVVPAGD